MRELLPDNIALAEWLDSLPTCSLSAKDTETREITAFASPHQGGSKVWRQRLGHLRFHVAEEPCWVDSRWDIIDPSLHIAHIMSQAQRPLPPCSICNEADHRADDCALVSLQPNFKGNSVPPPAREWALPYPRPGPSSGRPSFRPHAGQSPRICLSWNKGACKYPGACSYAHVCATCRGKHPAKSFPLTPQDSAFRQAPVY